MRQSHFILCGKRAIHPFRRFWMLISLIRTTLSWVVSRRSRLRKGSLQSLERCPRRGNIVSQDDSETIQKFVPLGVVTRCNGHRKSHAGSSTTLPHPFPTYLSDIFSETAEDKLNIMLAMPVDEAGMRTNFYAKFSALIVDVKASMRILKFN
ncbi:uncharacterized protein BCR38DRAFT_172899 [Pseudomassariella vexata]|uniref:Uncharacterized protein n=1 Tax=Pseudomassariella vexata TaxID=1141098 RepID=A0A1Y2E5G6_9PEZI|nr:uncharacterized protein BCR38DRAFT_172899 [Pseudomassariella vexata]ORY66105.1 hypothetical protein BCR38DRAFT_172899 [Pseudomassariella vexata]